jgi:hypothetical protein
MEGVWHSMKSRVLNPVLDANVSRRIALTLLACQYILLNSRTDY